MGGKMRLIAPVEGLMIGEVYNCKLHDENWYVIPADDLLVEKNKFQAPELPIRVRVEEAKITYWYKIGDIYTVIGLPLYPTIWKLFEGNNGNSYINKSDCIVLGAAEPGVYSIVGAPDEKPKETEVVAPKKPPFYLIYRMGDRETEVRHSTYENALAQCDRIATKDGGEVYVLAAIYKRTRNVTLIGEMYAQ